MDKLQGFVAYPSNPHQIGTCIKSAIQKVNSFGGANLDGWEENDVAGRSLTAPIFENIRESNILIADITKLNFNVTYEIGYAIGIGKRVFLIKNKELSSDESKITKVGIFDTLGYEEYENESKLSQILNNVRDLKPLNVSYTPNINTPAYIVETPVRGQVTTHIIARVKKARLFYRSFIPAENSRLFANEAITHVAQSFGVVIPLLSQDNNDSELHNIRAAFVAGLSHGMDIHTLILQDGRTGPVPLDVRDTVKTYERPEDIDRHIHEFSLNVYEAIQHASDLHLPEGNLLSQISIGDPMAENELQTLGSYYLQTDEFSRVLRGEQAGRGRTHVTT
ncbi:MAG: hypothetical protein WD750_07895 [Gammaproteobacteria bacterium]